MGQLPSGRRYALSKDEMELVNLIDEIGRKNERALTEFYDRTKAFVFSLASRILSDKKDAEDISLEVFMQVWNSASNYDCNRSAPMPWLIMITRSRSIDHLRSKDKRINSTTFRHLQEMACSNSTTPCSIYSNGRNGWFCN